MGFHLFKKSHKGSKGKIKIDPNKIRSSGLFDESWYKARYGIDQACDALEHYLGVGYKLGFNPSPKFDGNEYLSKYPSVKKAALNPLIHYLKYGFSENKEIFTTSDYLLLNSDLFDEDWYRKRYGINQSTDAVGHYLDQGWTVGFNPSPRFDGNEYLKAYPDLQNAKINPLVHYLRFGYNENRIISATNDDLIRSSELFDEVWYHKAYKLDQAVDAVGHYLDQGWLIGCNPSPLFDSNKYLEQNPDVRESNINPLIHYLKFGYNENRAIFTTDDYLYLIRKSEFFDENWYHQTYKLDASIEAADHYLETGWLLGFNPSPLFDGNEYLKFNPDVKAVNLNPLLHYLKHGSNENRKIYPTKEYLIRSSELFDESWYRTTYKIDPQVDAVIHYLKEGSQLGYNPSEHFDQNLYLSFYDEIKGNPLVDYLKYEDRKGSSEINPNNPIETKFKVDLTIPDLDVLILTTIPKNDPVYIYCVDFKKQWLERNGITAAAESYAEPSCDFLSRFYKAGKIIIVRSSFSDIVAKLIREIQKQNKVAYYDLDDLVFTKFINQCGAFKSNIKDYYQMVDCRTSDTLSIMCFQECLVSTPLVKKYVVEELGLKGAYVIPHVLPTSYFALKERTVKENEDQFIIGYTHTHTHTHDSSTILLDLMSFLASHNDAVISIIGEKSLYDLLNKLFPQQTIYQDYLPFDQLIKHYATYDLLLVPLADHEFNRAKTNIKYIEAAAVGTPILATDLDPYHLVIQDQVNGYLYTPDQFLTKLELIYNNRQELCRVGKNANEHALKHLSTEAKLPDEIKELL